MARLTRISPLGIPQYIIQRGNNRQICFGSEQDMAVYASWLGEYSQEFGVSLHAWVFMTNHVHLLATPRQDAGISAMMQALGRRYVRYFNKKYLRSGTLWEGRFKSSLVQSENYFLVCQRYIELNPVRAGMVSNPAEYSWSSYQAHALGKQVEMHFAHQEYNLLGADPEERQGAYRALFKSQIDDCSLDNIRCALKKGLAFGSERFKLEVETLTGRRVKAARLGRPKVGIY